MSDAGSLGLGGAGIGIGTSLAGAFSQNENIRKAGSANREAAILQYGQIDDAAALEVRKRANDTQRIRGRLRVLGGASGLSTDGSFAALDDQATRDQAISDAITKTNAYNAKLNIGSQLKAHLIEQYSRMGNPLLEGLQGGLSGYSAGTKIGDYVYGRPTSPNVDISGRDLSGGGWLGGEPPMNTEDFWQTYSGGYGIDPALTIGGGYSA